MRNLIFVVVAYAVVLSYVSAALAQPQVGVSAEHLGGGLVQYTLDLIHEEPALSVVNITVAGSLNQLPSDFFDTVDFLSDADLADMFDPVYQAAGGKTFDSWFNFTHFSSTGPPFGGVIGGEVGSTEYSASLHTAAPDDAVLIPNMGQFVIFDAAAAILPIGPVSVVSTGLAPLSIIDPDPLDSTKDSTVSTGGQTFSLVREFAVVPEPSSFALGAFALAVLLTHAAVRRRRN